jgi:Zn-dependent protease with chaperone function
MSFWGPLEFLSPPALVALSVSACVWIALRLGQSALERLTPAAQARVYLTAALAPAFAGTVFFGGAVADWLRHGPMEMCLQRERSGHSSDLLLALGLAFGGRILIGGAGLIRGIWRAQRLARALGHCTPSSTSPRCRVLPFDETQAFVLGIVRPEIYVTRGLLAAAHSEDLAPVLAHEEAHVRKRDPLRRLIASAGLLFHLPGVTATIERRLTRAQEMAADSEAAGRIGDRIRFAEVLVWFARLQSFRPVSACEFSCGDIDARVRGILESTPRRDAFRPAALLVAASSITVLALAAANPLHRLSELLLGLP